MFSLRSITANLPAIGAFRVNLHCESERIVRFFGEEELDRLGRIDHLGAATVAFPGVNHKRLEYVLLQCAIAQIVAKLYKNNVDLALSNSVELSGSSIRVSSAEELLKCWVLFGNIGHPNWTFSTERVLMNGAIKEPQIQDWLISGAIESDLREWARNAIQSCDDRRARLLVTLIRLKEQRPHDSRKHLFRHMIRNFVLPEQNLKFSSAAARKKISRLRQLHDQIQLLAMVMLDAYHSHSPVRLQLLPALQELAESATQAARLERFMGVVRSTAGWLADEVYLHPTAVAVQYAYESRCSRNVVKKFTESCGSSAGRRQFLRNILSDGFSRPRASELEHLVRLTFARHRPNLLGAGTRPSRIARLNSKISVKPSTFVSVEDNWFTGATHLDLLYSPRTISSKRLGRTYARLVSWLVRSIETESLETVRRLYRIEDRDEKRKEAQRIRVMKHRLRASEHHLMKVLLSVVKNLIPQGFSVGMEPVAEWAASDPIAWRLVDSHGVIFDELLPRIDAVHQQLVDGGFSARALEVDAMRVSIGSPQSSAVAALLHPIVIRDSLGRTKDEWDGCILTADKDEISLIVVEAKGGTNRARRAQEAFEQLADTRAILKGRYGVRTKRCRLRNRGAFLAVSF